VFLQPRARVETPLAVIAAVPDQSTRERCSFCGKRRGQVTGLASTGDAAICAECLKLCDEIVAERLS
jgi:ClpX C4-type zinc finger protein